MEGGATLARAAEAEPQPLGGLGRRAQGTSSRGQAAHLHVEFSQLPLKHRWVRREGHRANICREEREAQVGLDPQARGLHGLKQHMHDAPPPEGERSWAQDFRDPHKEEGVGERLPGLPAVRSRREVRPLGPLPAPNRTQSSAGAQRWSWG